MINIKRGSGTHVALKYLKMKSKTYCTVESLRNLSPNKYKDNYNAKRSYEQLVKFGYAVEHNGTFKITPSGVQALYLMVQKNPKPQPVDD